MIRRSHLAALATTALVLSGCALANEQMAYRAQQRRDCVAAGGYFTDQYTCDGLHNASTSAPPPAAPAPPMKCEKHETTVKKDDGTTETNATETCSSF